MIKRNITSIWGKIFIACVSIMSFAGNAFAQNIDNSSTGTSGDMTNTATAPSTSSFNVTKYLEAEGQNLGNVIGEGKNPIGSFIIRAVNFLSLMIGSLAFLAIIIGAFFLLTSAGDQNRTTRGKDIIKFAIMGLLAAMLAYFMTAFIQSIFYEYGTATTAP